MADKRRLWLIDNQSSGSHTAEARSLLADRCGEHGFSIAQHTDFPRCELPDPAMLDAAGVDLVAVFAGDGTINSTINHLAGWTGAVLVLPGGTMNLLYHRLHGNREMEEVIGAVAAGLARRVRPTMVRGQNWKAFAGLMAGPGTSWNHVREAMRDNSIIEMAGHTVEAIEQSLGGALIACSEPALGRREGYPLILLHPTAEAIEVLAYHAETAMDYLGQTLALLKRDFRKGPHDELGRVQRLVLASTDGRPFGILVDGEPSRAEETETAFELAQSEVDLWATEAEPDGHG